MARKSTGIQLASLLLHHLSRVLSERDVSSGRLWDLDGYRGRK